MLKYLSFLLMIVALVGFYKSSSLHLDIVLHPGKVVVKNWWLSLGIFVVWIPAVFASHKLVENSSEKDSWYLIIKQR
ncbi:MAG: hypothetical protein MJK14_21055 [Rivularia sp. ALOHA_DT_140]|nr:hypothetical protein [Rivularia sp. ALOHA_DT_140]